jgi:hypothetical protein
MLRTSKLCGVLAALSVVAATSVASASSHREAPAISEDPAADNTDLWAWAEGPTLHVVASYIPLEEPSGGPNFNKFSDDVLYEIHITKGVASLADAATYQFRFSTAALPRTAADGSATFGGREFFAQLAGTASGGWPVQTYTVTKIVNGTASVIGTGTAAPPNAGPRTDTVLQQTYNDAFAATFLQTLGTDGVSWAGPRDDGFYVDLGGVFDLANLRLSPAPGKTAQDGVAGFNSHAIAIDIPLAGILGHAPGNGPSNADLLGVWASASRQKVSIIRHDGTTTHLGPWTQVSRLGIPLINEAVIGLQDKDKYNRTVPADDVTNFGSYFLNPVIVKDAEAVMIYAAYGVADASSFETNRLDIIGVINMNDIPTAGAHAVPLTATGDVLRVDPGFPAGFPNGRPVGGGPTANQDQSDVTDVILSLALTKLTVPPGCGGPAVPAVGDCVDSNDKPYLASIPYLALPWRGFDEGHGKVTNP